MKIGENSPKIYIGFNSQSRDARATRPCATVMRDGAPYAPRNSSVHCENNRMEFIERKRAVARGKK